MKVLESPAIQVDCRVDEINITTAELSLADTSQMLPVTPVKVRRNFLTLRDCRSCRKRRVVAKLQSVAAYELNQKRKLDLIPQKLDGHERGFLEAVRKYSGRLIVDDPTVERRSFG